MKLRDVVELLLLAMLWGGSFLMIRISVPEFGAIALMAMRTTIAGLLLLPILLWKKGLPDITHNLKPIVIVGLFNSALPFSLLAYAAITFTAGFTSILNATAPLWTAVVAIVWLKDRPNKAALIGLLVGFMGVVAMVWDKISMAQSTNLLALGAGLLATLCYGGCAHYAKKNLSGVNSLAIACGSLLAASLFLLPFGAYYWPQQAISSQAWISMIIMSIFSTALAIVLYFRLIANIGPSKAVTVTYLIPVFGMFFGALWLDEVVTVEMLIGCGLILLGTSLATGLLNVKALLSKKVK